MEELFAGESRNIEYKREVPGNSAKYMKTVVAFANGKGGKIIFGVEDQTGKIVGMDRDSVFQKMDAITNAISDSCEPRIIPDVTLRTIDDKTLIVVEISAGRQQPYFLKSLGIREGTYIRVAGTTRLVEDYMLKELILEGQNRHYDQEPCDGLTVTKDEIDQLCRDLKAVAVQNALTDEVKSQVKDVTQNTLITWGVLAEKDGMIVPTNAYALLANKTNIPPVIQCAIFKGVDRSIFVDRREISGSIQNQVEAVYQYVLEKINLGAKIEGLYRQDVYEFPIGSIRELIANAVAHRSYLEPGNIQVALYDNRLEITSPGMLLNGVSIEKMKEGYSKIRNRAISNAFSYMKIIEKWGSGIPRIIRECREYGLREPELIDLDGDFRVNLYREYKNGDTSSGTIGTIGTNFGTNHKIAIEEQQIIAILKTNPKSTQKNIQEQMKISIRSVKRIMADLQGKGVIIRKGNNRTGEWIVLENERYQ
ncbi:MAG: putative DNA binding domain-containing protein [Candidatus Cloacimonetes bacterium]|nr:putative DNA binding domain-containing protein [Candidatus Cloacimonadota bacterium]MDY0230279.1 ATP-binding protein [Candidatus Cloacimonadaceae bacterium]